MMGLWPAEEIAPGSELGLRWQPGLPGHAPVMQSHDRLLLRKRPPVVRQTMRGYGQCILFWLCELAFFCQV